MLCWLLQYNSMNHLSAYLYPLFLEPPSSPNLLPIPAPSYPTTCPKFMWDDSSWPWQGDIHPSTPLTPTCGWWSGGRIMVTAHVSARSP